jgi:copper chaperone NosL
VLFGIIAMADFWRWEYNYGHNLDPNAAIIVPGMAYQPPLIGFKQLLNFGAYSIPDTGGWIFIGAGLLLLICFMLEWKINRTSVAKKSIKQMAIAITGIMMLSSCGSGPDPIKVGKDNCYICKMTIADEKYGAELISNKGKVYKFDDIGCLRSFMQTGIIEKSKVRDIYLVDYAGDHSLVNVKQCYLIQGESIKGPMNGHVIAFREKSSMEKMMVQLNAVAIEWEQFIP